VYAVGADDCISLEGLAVGGFDYTSIRVLEKEVSKLDSECETSTHQRYGFVTSHNRARCTGPVWRNRCTKES
jgi:hypothetical protein